MYEKLTESLRKCGRLNIGDECICFHDGCCEAEPTCIYELMRKAADAIAELFKAAKAMHTWIFLNTGDEQAAYDDCGLSDELNAALGYCGAFEMILDRPKEEKDDAE